MEARQKCPTRFQQRRDRLFLVMRPERGFLQAIVKIVNRGRKCGNFDANQGMALEAIRLQLSTFSLFYCTALRIAIQHEAISLHLFILPFLWPPPTSPHSLLVLSSRLVENQITQICTDLNIRLLPSTWSPVSGAAWHQRPFFQDADPPCPPSSPWSPPRSGPGKPGRIPAEGALRNGQCQVCGRADDQTESEQSSVLHLLHLVHHHHLHPGLTIVLATI